MKKFRIWLPIIAFLAVIVNLLGLDELNLLLMGVSPLAWVKEFIPGMHRVDIPISLAYIAAVLFWFGVGFLIDMLIQSSKKNA
ncbi:hypothetical protein J45TS6_47830 [Paenibacillus sp. J45TS6]|uniref:hypothetical protein n=1 Tax=unclassified Paenibacillus TaxID=185978 RepID=UPI001B005616|nr:hypothetical protein [Paenibacillus sp. J45TS6]GIP46324.1 hypothetical protein J45TS6_47830 [Paenibacillus sp. J45TS6]